MRIVDKDTVLEIAQETFEKYLLEERVIVENAGNEMANKLIKDYDLKDDNHLPVVFLVGSGSNGADGVAAARYLFNKGVNVRVFLVKRKEDFCKELNDQLSIAVEFGVALNLVEKQSDLEAYFIQNINQHIIIDALYGTGARFPLSDGDYSLIKMINDSDHKVIAIDLPSGLDCNSGLVQGNAIRAEKTYCIGFPKLGCYQADGGDYCGEISVLEVGFPKKLKEEGALQLVTDKSAIATAKQRNKFADKKIYGHTLVIGGSHGQTGSLALASHAALKVGAGLITAATWEAQYYELLSRLIPEIKTGYIPKLEENWEEVLKSFDKYDSIVIGPGMGNTQLTRKIVLNILNNYQGPVVLDADAIYALDLKEDASLIQNRMAPTILTPHLDEFSELIKVSSEKVYANPVKYLKEVVSLTNCFILLKGACSYLSCPTGTTYLSSVPNSGMATGGVGDVLSGILGGLLSQDRNLRDNISNYKKIITLDKTILLGLVLHSKAGLKAAKKLGERVMTASSIIDSLASAFEEIEG